MGHSRHYWTLAVGFSICAQIASFIQYSYQPGPHIVCAGTTTAFGWPFIAFYIYRGAVSYTYLSPSMILVNLLCVVGVFAVAHTLLCRRLPRYTLKLLLGTFVVCGAVFACERWADIINETLDVRDWHFTTWSLRENLR